MRVIEEKAPEKRQQICRKILEELPEWFGLPAATEDYIQKSREQVMLRVADAGFLTLVKTSAVTAEIYVMGISRTSHRKGIGRLLIKEALRWCRENGYLFLQVKTLADSHPDPHYQKTRAFYEAVGFLPVEVFPELWGVDNPCLQMIQSVPNPGNR